MSEEFLISQSPKQLLQLTGVVIDELIRRGINRTGNNPLSDYTEYLVAKRYGWKLAPSSEQGYDLIDPVTNHHYEVKGRRISARNKSRQLGAIRAIDEKHFESLIAVIFDESFEVLRVMEIPWKFVKARSRPARHTNSVTLTARDNLLEIKGVRDLTSDFRGFELPPS